MKTGWTIFFAVLFTVTMLPAIAIPAHTPRWFALVGFLTVVVGGGLEYVMRWKMWGRLANERRAQIDAARQVAQQTNEPPKPDADV
jgi:hypothetical protein